MCGGKMMFQCECVCVRERVREKQNESGSGVCVCYTSVQSANWGREREKRSTIN